MLCLASCAGPQTAPAVTVTETQPAEFDALNYFGDDTPIIVSLDLRLARNSAHFRVLVDALAAVARDAELAGNANSLPGAFLSLAEVGDRITMKLGAGSIFVIEGDFPLATLNSWLLSRNGTEAEIEHLQLGPMRAMQSGRGLAVELAPGRFLVGPEPVVRRVALHPTTSSVNRTDAYRRTSARLPDGAFLTAVILNAENGERPKLSQDVGYETAAFGLVAGPELAMQAVFLGGDEAEARLLGEYLPFLKQHYLEQLQPVLGPFENLGQTLESVQIRHDTDSATASVSIGIAPFQELLMLGIGLMVNP